MISGVIQMMNTRTAVPTYKQIVDNKKKDDGELLYYARGRNLWEVKTTENLILSLIFDISTSIYIMRAYRIHTRAAFTMHTLRTPVPTCRSLYSNCLGNLP